MRVLVCVALLAGCYAPGTFADCALQCSPSGGCPLGASCGSDGYCHRGGSAASCSALSQFAGAQTATAVGEHAIRLTWEAASSSRTPAAELTYRVYTADTPGAETFGAPTFTSVPGATEVELVGFAPRTTTYFVVQAVDGAGQEDDNRVERSATTPDLTPPTFAGVTEALAAGAAVELHWSPASDNVDGADQIAYRVYLATAPGAESFAVPTATTARGATQTKLNGLVAGTVYYVVVRAVDQAGNEDGNVVERSVSPADVAPPTFAGATGATSGTNSITLSWSAAHDDVTPTAQLVYLVYASTASGGESFATPTATTSPSVTSFVVPGLLASTKYYFVVRARDAAGNVDGTGVEVSATTAAANDTTPPTFAGLATATSGGDSSIALAWSAASDDVTSAAQIVYFVYQATATHGESFAAPTYTSAPGATSMTVSGLMPSTTYYFVVRARDAAGNPDSNTVEHAATTAADTTPPSFAGVAALQATAPNGVSASWAPAGDDVAPPSKIVYLAFVGTAPGGESFAAPMATSAPGVTSMPIGGLQPSTTYYVVVRARDPSGNVDGNLVEKMVKTPADVTPPAFAGAQSAKANDSSTITLAWSAATDDVSAPGEITYLVYEALFAGNESYSSATYTTSPGATQLVVTGLLPAKSYFFVVRARDRAGNVDRNTVEVSAATPLL
ncbi:MAG: Fibronectin type domain protein [bacterium]|nr:Fibronectin type domain protein [bacterium]